MLLLQLGHRLLVLGDGLHVFGAGGGEFLRRIFVFRRQLFGP